MKFSNFWVHEKCRTLGFQLLGISKLISLYFIFQLILIKNTHLRLFIDNFHSPFLHSYFCIFALMHKRQRNLIIIIKHTQRKHKIMSMIFLLCINSYVEHKQYTTFNNKNLSKWHLILKGVSFYYYYMNALSEYVLKLSKIFECLYVETIVLI